jgi:GNAT superfamily N-acetyltransferase
MTPGTMEWRRAGYLISTDRERLDRETIWQFLRTAYWSPGIPLAKVEKAIENSLAFGLFSPDGEQVGFARIVTDRVSFAWLADVFVLEQHRGNGLGMWLVGTAVTHPEVADVRVLLGTLDAHGLYERIGFRPVDPRRLMERRPAAKDAAGSRGS